MKSIWDNKHKLKTESKDKDEETKSLFEKLYNQPIYIQPELILHESYRHDFELTIENTEVDETTYTVTFIDKTT